MGKVMGLPSWEDVYKSKNVKEMPWYFKELDPDLARELNERGITKGRFLDIGTGPGTQAIALAKLGFEATGTDISASAVKKAKALDGAGKARFVVDDMLDSRLEKDGFDFIIDRGAFHTLKPEQWSQYLATVNRILASGGLLFLKCFSIDEPREGGPRKFTKEEIRNIFSRDFEIESIRDSVYYGKGDAHPKTLFSVLRKK